VCSILYIFLCAIESYSYIYIYIYICMYIYIYIYILTKNIQNILYASIHTWRLYLENTPALQPARKKWRLPCIQTHMPTYTPTYPHTYMYTHAGWRVSHPHTHIHTCTHMQAGVYPYMEEVPGEEEDDPPTLQPVPNKWRLDLEAHPIDVAR
jgi:hypothetical protein